MVYACIFNLYIWCTPNVTSDLNPFLASFFFLLRLIISSTAGYARDSICAVLFLQTIEMMRWQQFVCQYVCMLFNHTGIRLWIASFTREKNLINNAHQANETEPKRNETREKKKKMIWRRLFKTKSTLDTFFYTFIHILNTMQ